MGCAVEGAVGQGRVSLAELESREGEERRLPVVPATREARLCALLPTVHQLQESEGASGRVG